MPRILIPCFSPTRPPRASRRRRIIVVTAVILALVWGGLRISGIRIGINLTRSQPGWVYLVVPDRKIHRGDLVVFRFPGSRYYPEGTLFVKEAVGLPGDRLDAGKETVLLNEKKLGTLLKTDSLGRPIAPFAYQGLIPEGAYFMFAHAHNSYDSRYFGFVPGNRIVGKVVPVF